MLGRRAAFKGQLTDNQSQLEYSPSKSSNSSAPRMRANAWGKDPPMRWRPSDRLRRRLRRGRGRGPPAPCDAMPCQDQHRQANAAQQLTELSSTLGSRTCCVAAIAAAPGWSAPVRASTRTADSPRARHEAKDLHRRAHPAGRSLRGTARCRPGRRSNARSAARAVVDRAPPSRRCQATRTPIHTPAPSEPKEVARRRVAEGGPKDSRQRFASTICSSKAWVRSTSCAKASQEVCRALRCESGRGW